MKNTINGKYLRIEIKIVRTNYLRGNQIKQFININDVW